MIKNYEKKEDFDQFLKDIIDALYSGSYEDLAGDVHDLDDLLYVPPMLNKHISKGNVEKMMNLISSLHLSLEDVQETFFQLLDLLRDEGYLVEDKNGNLKIKEEKE